MGPFLVSHSRPLHTPHSPSSHRPRRPTTLSRPTFLSGKRGPAYPDRRRPRRLAGWRADSAGAAVAAPDPALSPLCPGSAPRIGRASEMDALIPRAALRTAHQTTWRHHSTHPILPTRLLLRVTPDARVPRQTYSSLPARPSDSVSDGSTGELGSKRAGAKLRGRLENGGAGWPRRTPAEHGVPPAFTRLVALTQFNIDPYSSILVPLPCAQGRGVV